MPKNVITKRREVGDTASPAMPLEQWPGGKKKVIKKKKASRRTARRR
jgi:hypothetical protein